LVAGDVVGDAGVTVSMVMVTRWPAGAAGQAAAGSISSS
jgi:hypothetical protein